VNRDKTRLYPGQRRNSLATPPRPGARFAARQSLLFALLVVSLLILFPDKSGFAEENILMPWSNRTKVDDFTDQSLPLMGGVFTDGRSALANKLFLHFQCRDNELLFGSKAEGLDLMSMHRPTTIMRIDKRPPVDNFFYSEGSSALIGDDAKALALQMTRGKVLRVRVTVNGKRTDWEIPLRGFADVFRDSLPQDCKDGGGVAKQSGG